MTEAPPVRYVLLKDMPDYDLLKGDTVAMTENSRTFLVEKDGNDTFFLASTVQNDPQTFERLW